MWLDDLKENEAPRISVDTPHQLVRTLEVLNILTCNEMIIHASLARKASSPNIGFYRLDYPTPNPPEWHKWITLRLDKDRIVSAEVPLDFWKPMIENYEKHNH
jgi:succinate dehydrogenase/fumarate reductase flavoprotein subunit